jgi:hypothetical protein
MDLPVGVNSVQPVALWPGTLGFKADQILNSFDPTSPGFTIQGDLIIKQMPAEHLNLRFYLNALLGGQVIAAPVIPPYIVVYRRTVLTSNYLYSTVLPPLRNALAVFNTQGKILNIEVDLLRAFVRGEVMINTDTSSGGRFLLPPLTPDPQTLGKVKLELVCGLVAGDEQVAFQSAGSDHPGFVPFPVEHLYQLVVDRFPLALAPGETQHGLLPVLTAATRSDTIMVIPEPYLPEAGRTVEDCYPSGLPSRQVLNWRYRMYGAPGAVREASIPPNARIYSGNAFPYPNSYMIEEAINGVSSSRDVWTLAPQEVVPETLPAAGPNPITLLAPGGTLVIRNSTLSPQLNWIKSWMLFHRDVYNQNNPTRTDFYLRFWLRHNELPWVLLAHLVSRNAGYQMSDFGRYKAMAALGGAMSQALINFAIRILGSDTQPAIQVVMDLFFAFTEAGNYLIVRDVFPQLAAYQWAKAIYRQQGLDISHQVFDMLKEPEFEVDPYVIDEWKVFFAEARKPSVNWWTGQPNVAALEVAKRLNLTLIVNEQNHIEERLVNDPTNRYLGKIGPYVTRVIQKFTEWHKTTQLVFTVATSVSNSTPSHLLLYALGDFTSLDARIETGTKLYAGVFLYDANRRDRVQMWAKTYLKHRGTRVDYDSYSYTVDSLATLPGGLKFSPLLVESPGKPVAWPVKPREDSRFRHIHTRPTTLPPWSQKVTSSRINNWRRVTVQDPFTQSTLGVGRSLDELPPDEP